MNLRRKEISQLNKILTLVSVVFVFVLTVTAVSAHEVRKKDAPGNSSANTRSADSNDTGVASEPTVGAPETHDHGLTEFPTFHPLVVHFPIVLIIVAAVFQILSLFVFRREFSWAVVFLALFGAVGAYLASNVFHPHTTELSENAQRLLLEHELYADLTFWLAAGGLLAKLVSNFIFKRPWWGETIATLALIGAAVAVALAGHHGAELVHKEGVGPKGNFLEMHDH
jgi:uncharacterized membrane protein